jgi:CubicO group peptidase (beta-lactamase class C family)
VNRLFLVLALLLAAAFATYQTIGGDSLYWKRRLLLTVFSSANLPDSYFEPSQLIEGASDGQSIPRVDPEQEKLGRDSLDLAAQYANEHDAQALIIGRHGHIVFERYWNGAAADTVVDAGSFNATLTALAFGMATADRKIALTAEPVANYIESFRDPPHSTVTLEHLLRMSSGLGPSSDAAVSATADLKISTREQLARDIRTECLEREPIAAPGTRWQVQPCDAQLLAHIIERATGEAYATYLSKSLWKTIGASDAQLMLDHEGGTAHAACCLRARLGDWMRIGQLLANDGRFEGEQMLPPGWVRTMTTPANPQIPFGYQVWLGAPFAPGGGNSEPYVADDLFYLRGHGPTRLWIVPSMSLIILLVGTSDAAGPAWDDSRIPNLVIRGASDYVPKAPQGAQDIKNLVPNH